MALDINDIVKNVTKGKDTSTNNVKVSTGSTATTKSSSGLVA